MMLITFLNKFIKQQDVKFYENESVNTFSVSSSEENESAV